jgi:hypothetical protein
MKTKMMLALVLATLVGACHSPDPAVGGYEGPLKDSQGNVVQAPAYVHTNQTQKVAP